MSARLLVAAILLIPAPETPLPAPTPRIEVLAAPLDGVVLRLPSRRRVGAIREPREVVGRQPASTWIGRRVQGWLARDGDLPGWALGVAGSASAESAARVDDWLAVARVEVDREQGGRCARLAARAAAASGARTLHTAAPCLQPAIASAAALSLSDPDAAYALRAFRVHDLVRQAVWTDAVDLCAVERAEVFAHPEDPHALEWLSPTPCGADAELGALVTAAVARPPATLDATGWATVLGYAIAVGDRRAASFADGALDGASAVADPATRAALDDRWVDLRAQMIQRDWLEPEDKHDLLFAAAAEHAPYDVDATATGTFDLDHGWTLVADDPRDQAWLDRVERVPPPSMREGRAVAGASGGAWGGRGFGGLGSNGSASREREPSVGSGVLTYTGSALTLGAARVERSADDEPHAAAPEPPIYTPPRGDPVRLHFVRTR